MKLTLFINGRYITEEPITGNEKQARRRFKKYIEQTPRVVNWRIEAREVSGVLKSVENNP